MQVLPEPLLCRQWMKGVLMMDKADFPPVVNLMSHSQVQLVWPAPNFHTPLIDLKARVGLCEDVLVLIACSCLHLVGKEGRSIQYKYTS